MKNNSSHCMFYKNKHTYGYIHRYGGASVNVWVPVCVSAFIMFFNEISLFKDV